jgi:hypothetical protein
MKAMSWLRARPRALASGAIVGIAAIGITTMAVAYEGNPTTELDLHDGSAWITKAEDQLVGHFNAESRVLDGQLGASSDQYDVLQDGDRALVHDQSGSTLARIEAAGLTLGNRVDLPAGAAVDYAADTVAILAPSGGQLFVVPLQGVASFVPAEAEPVLELGEGAVMTVGRDGTVYAASSKNSAVYTVRVTPEGMPEDPSERRIDGLDETSELALTSVADKPVLLERTSGDLIMPGGQRVPVRGAADAQLAQDAADGDAVIVATGDALLSAPLDGSAPTALRAPEVGGTPAAPVWLGGCAYGAWMGAGTFVRDCLGEQHDNVSSIDDYRAEGELRFRVNRDIVLLNNVLTGGAWLASDQLQKVDNWEKLTPPKDEKGIEDDEKTTVQVPDPALPDRTQQNRPPVAEGDAFGVRAGKTATLPVLMNDSDPDGDVLTVVLPEKDPSIGHLQLVQDGAAIQITVEEGASGSATFEYVADDGRKGTDEASVTLEVRPDSENVGPQQEREVAIPVETGGTVTYNVLPDWIDMDGDTVYLQSVEPLKGDEVDFTPDGRVTYRARSGAQGPTEVPVVVTDGEASTRGVLKLDVRPVGSTVPITTADHVVTQVGRQVTVSPLANDVSASSEPLRLARVDEVEGATVEPDFQAKTFDFTAEVEGTYYAQYLASTGPNAVPGLVRIDVVPPADQGEPPVAVRDIALMPAGGEALIDVLANDADPMGGVLVVQSVTAEDSTGLSVSVLGHETLRIADRAVLAGQMTITYTVSNGYASAQGEVVVIPVPPADKLRPPVANDDQAVVRAGDVVTIPVLENDYHPNDDDMRVLPELPEMPEEGDGEMFVSEDSVRYRAPSEPGTYYGAYEVADSVDNKAAGYITVQVLPVDAENNAAPRPDDITARAVAGTPTTVIVPLDGIDSDGDSVELVGLATAPRKGRLVSIEAGQFDYEPYDDAAGVDTFQYRVRDALGAESTATVRIGIAPETTKNQSPYAVRDSLAVRPGRVVAVPVADNDSDPDGDSFGVTEDGLTLPEGVDLKARVIDAKRVEVTAPDEPLETSLQYTLRDERGATAQGVLQVTVDETVPLQMPIARDDRVLAENVDEELTAEVDLFLNDEDPDGTTDALDLEIEPDDGLRRLDGGNVRVQIGDERRVIGYTITDEDGQVARAFLMVPSVQDLGPALITTEPVVVDSHTRTELPLEDYVWVPGGGEVRITEAAKAVAAHSDGSPLVLDARTLVYTSAERYAGADALTFEVTDGDGPEDPDGRTSTLTLQIEVRPPVNEQPEFTGADLAVGAGDDPSTLDLGALAEDIDGDELRFDVAGAPSGIEASVNGDTLSVRAGADQKGATAQLRITVSDGQTEPVQGAVDIRVTASTRNLPVATDDRQDRWNQGETLVLDVLSNDYNPFPGTPLEIVSATAEAGSGDVQVQGSSLAITPAADFHGQMVVRYRIQDETHDEDRMVEGRAYVTVQGAPDAPGRPTVTNTQDRQVTMNWSASANNGAEISHYIARSTRGDYEQICPSTTCTLTGLTNNVEYNFEVVAVNDVGPSEPSLASETARPDVRPDTPAAPTIPDFGDGSLRIAWQTPHTAGSPVSSYTLEISPAAPNGLSQIEVQEVNPNATFRVWEGLQNGVAYQFRVRAHNAAPEPSDWSAWSASEIPAAPPAAPAQPTTQRLEPVGNQAQLQVTWNAPAANGDAIRGYQLDVLSGGAVKDTIPVSASQTTQAVAVPADSSNYTFRVRAQNKAGFGEHSPQSAPRQAFAVPGAPTQVSASTPTNDSRIHLTWQAGSLNGARSNQVSYQYSIDGGGWSGAWASGGNGSATINATNGKASTVRIRAVTNADGASYVSEPSKPSNEAMSYGPLREPSVSANRVGDGTKINFTWDARGSENGRQISVRVTGDVNISGAARGDVTQDYGYSQTKQITVTVTDTAGQSISRSASARTVDPPQPSATVSVGGSAANAPNCTSNDCQYLRLNYRNLPTADYRVTCENNQGGWHTFGSRSMRLSGDGWTDMNCYFGFPGQQVRLHIQGGGHDFRTPEFTWP